ncbi:MAG: hypothetical protein JRI39_03915 [Deltaproteobacteria bacterium]|nr:hypothetical protein [Deltaproteobacteria bacterium]
MPRGEDIEFIIETEKLEKIKKVVKHNDGKIVGHENLPGAVKLRVRKT